MKEIKNKSYSVVQSELGLWVLRITPIRYLNYIISNIKKKSTERMKNYEEIYWNKDCSSRTNEQRRI